MTHQRSRRYVSRGTIPRGIAFVGALLLIAGGPVVARGADPATDPHSELFAEKQYPSAMDCAKCHERIYEEWRSSAHAYASISPMFNKFEQRINELASGTVGDFCMRCHSTVSTSMGEKRYVPLWDRTEVAREGVTCITCHRIDEEYNRVDGERRVVPGSIYAAMTGSGNGANLKEVIAHKDQYKVKTAPGGAGQDIHTNIFHFAQITRSDFCISCHQVAVQPQIKLEVVWEQYRASPAAQKGIQCQDCHMGKDPGLANGYDLDHAAVVSGQPIGAKRTHHDHSFPGPGYAIAHPGIFPHPSKDNLDQAKAFRIQDWMAFNWLPGSYRIQNDNGTYTNVTLVWGSDDFEGYVSSGKIKTNCISPLWIDKDRSQAYDIIQNNLTAIQKKLRQRDQIMANGSRLDGPFFREKPRLGRPLKFYYKVTNLNPGHNFPSGSLGAQPEIWLDVALISPGGTNIWESGYVDDHGDFCDLHSDFVHSNQIGYDEQLFNLQSKFLTTDVKGTDREMYLPVNIDFDQLPFIRPGANPVSVMNHPPFIRMEQRSLPPLGSRLARYTVPGAVMQSPGQYKLAVRLRSRAEPIYFMRFCRSTLEMQRLMNERTANIHPYAVEFDVE